MVNFPIPPKGEQERTSRDLLSCSHPRETLGREAEMTDGYRGIGWWAGPITGTSLLMYNLAFRMTVIKVNFEAKRLIRSKRASDADRSRAVSWAASVHPRNPAGHSIVHG